MTKAKTAQTRESSKALLKAIRHKCLECSNGSRKEVMACPMTSCSLYPYRSGCAQTAEDDADAVDPRQICMIADDRLTQNPFEA